MHDLLIYFYANILESSCQHPYCKLDFLLSVMSIYCSFVNFIEFEASFLVVHNIIDY